MMVLKPRTPRQQFFTVLAVVGGLAVLIIVGVIVPLFLRVQQLSGQLRETMKNQVNQEATFHASQTTSQDLKAVDPTIKQVNAYFLGDDRDLTVTLNMLETLAKNYMIDMRTPQLISNGTESTALGLTVQGSFFSMVNFMRRLEQFPKFSKIESFNFGSIIASSPTTPIASQLTGSLLFTIYLPPDTSKITQKSSAPPKPKNTDSIDN